MAEEYKLENSFGFQVKHVANRIHAVFSKLIESYGIAPEQFAVLKIISEDSLISQSAIAAALVKGKPTVSRTLDELEKKGFIVRRELPSDRRIKSTELTDAGRHALQVVLPVAKEINEAIVAQLDDDEIKTFFKVLDLVVKTVEQFSPDTDGSSNR